MAHRNHIVQFYDDEESLSRTVADFLGDGLRGGEPAVVIATEPHRAILSERLTSLGYDVDSLSASGMITHVDANAALSAVMVGGVPDGERFTATISPAIEAAVTRSTRSNPGVRAYGEMVDVLWRDGNRQAALRLEGMWNDLILTHPFHLLCAYAAGNFYKVNDCAQIRAICEAHMRVVPSAKSVDEEAIMLQHRARMLETEIRHREELERALRQALADVQRSEEALRRIDRRKDEFLAVLGHEMRDPLAAIVTALQLMRIRGDASTEHERLVIDRQAQHLVRLVEDLLDTARASRGDLVLKREHAEIAMIVARAIETVSPLLEQRRHRLTVSAPRNGLTVDADVTRLTQVFTNLLKNAAKFTEPNGRIDLTAAREGESVAVVIRDNGIGIAPDVLPHIFESFTQAHKHDHHAHGGLGLGLSIARTLTRLHGGTIHVDSEGPGRGSTFTVRLPLVHAVETARSSSSPSPGSDKKGPRMRILVVDDNVDGAELVADAVRMMDHEVRIAHDGATALRIAETFSPDAVMLDIGLPDMDGYELARHLRSRRAEGMRPLRLIALTGYGQDADRARSRDFGIDEHLVKPVDFAVLADVISRSAWTR